MNPRTPADCVYCEPYLRSNEVCALHYGDYLLHWRPRGFAFADHLPWALAVGRPVDAAAYREAGLAAEMAGAWAKTRLPADVAIAWHAAGITPDETVAWLEVRTVTTVGDQRAMVSAGHDPRTALVEFGAKARFRWSAIRLTAARTSSPGVSVHKNLGM